MQPKHNIAETWMLLEYCDRGNLDSAMRNNRFRRKADNAPDLVGGAFFWSHSCQAVTGTCSSGSSSTSHWRHMASNACISEWCKRRKLCTRHVARQISSILSGIVCSYICKEIRLKLACCAAGEHIQVLDRHRGRHGLPAPCGHAPWRSEGGQCLVQIHCNGP